MKNNVLRQLAVIITTVFTLIMNGAANAIPLNGRETGAISDSFNVLFVPAAYVFAIWGVIYVGLLAFTIYHSLPSQRTNPRLQKIGGWVAVSSLANGAWIYFWHFGQYTITLLIMLALLVTLLFIYLLLNIGKARFSNLEKWLVSIPFSTYLGWITVATIANATALFSYWGWDGGFLSAQSWTLVLLTAGVIIAALMAFTRSDIAYLLVLAWAFAGISVRWADMAVLNVAGYAAAALVLILLVVSRLLKRTA